jgi:hypothetical protein
MTRLLIVGVPRSGTTWVGQTLGAAAGAVYVNEPDGDHDPWAYRTRRGHPAGVRLRPGERAPDVERLWDGAFEGGRRPRSLRARAARYVFASTSIADRWESWLGGRETARLRLAAALAAPLEADPAATTVVVKTVRAELAVEWIAQRHRPTVLVVERDPRNVLASWIELGFVRDPREAEALAAVAAQEWGVAAPDLHGSLLTRQAFTYAVRAAVLRDALARNADWHVVAHEDLCRAPEEGFAALADRLGLRWDAAARERLTRADRAGTGYATERLAAQQPDRWRSRLTPAQVDEITAVLTAVPQALPRGA